MPPFGPPPGMPFQPQAREPRNALGLTALILALVGLVFVLVPLTGFIALILGIVALILAIAGLARVRRQRATNVKTTMAGLVLSVLAVAGGIWGITIVFGAFNDLDNALTGLDTPTVSAQATPKVTEQAVDDESTAKPGDNEQPETQAAASFTDVVTYDDGLKVEVSDLSSRKVGEYAAGGKPGEQMTVFTIKVTNTGKQAWDATLASPSVTYGANGQSAEDIFDEGVGNGFTGKILPGKSMSATWGFVIPKDGLSDVTLQMALGDFDREDAIFTGPVK